MRPRQHCCATMSCTRRRGPCRGRTHEQRTAKGPHWPGRASVSSRAVRLACSPPPPRSPPLHLVAKPHRWCHSSELSEGISDGRVITHMPVPLESSRVNNRIATSYTLPTRLSADLQLAILLPSPSKIPLVPHLVYYLNYLSLRAKTRDRSAIGADRRAARWPVRGSWRGGPSPERRGRERAARCVFVEIAPT